jgi:hypothetical protein
MQMKPNQENTVAILVAIFVRAYTRG